jgi:hypothetical protein
MSRPRDIREDLEPGLDPAAAESFAALGKRLEAGRPVPAAAFRGDLKRALMSQWEGLDRAGPAPARVRLWIALHGAAGAGLLLAAAASVAGVGPLAA